MPLFNKLIKMNAASEPDSEVEEFILGSLKEFSHDPVILYAAITHVKNLLQSIYASKITPEISYKLQIFKMFMDGIHAIHQTKNVPIDFMKDDSFSFLLGELCMNNSDGAKCAQLLRTRAFYMYVAVGDILELKVNRITDVDYELLIVHKHSLKFKIVDLNLIARLPKAGTTIDLAEEDYIRAAVKGFVKDSLELIVTLEENVREDLKHIELGKITKKGKACNKVPTNHKYFSAYLKTTPTFYYKFNASKWQTVMDEFGIDAFITRSSDEQCNNSCQIKEKPDKRSLLEYKAKLLVNPTAEQAEHARQTMANTLYKSAKHFDKQGNIKKAISCLEAAKVLWMKNKHSFFHSVKKNFSRKLLDVWLKK